MKIKIKEIHNISLITSVYELHSINSVTIEYVILIIITNWCLVVYSSGLY